MAKRSMTRALTIAAPRPVIVNAARPARRGKLSRRRLSGLRSRRGVKRSGAAVAGSLMLPVAAGGAVLGYAGGQGWLARLPQIGGSRMVTVGLLGAAMVKFSKNKTLRTVGIAAVGAAAFHFGLAQSASKKIEGDDGIEGEADY